MTKPAGIIAATATLFSDAEGAVDLGGLVSHCRRLLALGCDGVNLLGTTGEATSLPVARRVEVMRAVAASGLPLDRFMVGTGAASLADAAALTGEAVDLGFQGALVLPPFYYKGIDDAGLSAFFEDLIARTDRTRLRLYLYNFPQNTGIRFSTEWIRRLRDRHPDVLVGLKDSSGDIAAAKALARDLPGFAVFPSTETAVADIGSGAGAFAGVISASLNVTAPCLGDWRDAGDLAARIDKAGAIRAALSEVPLVAAVKWALADLTGEPGWRSLCPPLVPLNAGQEARLIAALAKTDYHSLRDSFTARRPN
ncbi:dihydrodipicolinate synthase family protein [Phreatobacter stygius]|uniref:Dihydrodipicolinate synthase family protein n=1 Tax=Phreatobacter stygius TaxID=1940610 RepID=A0A4D7BCH9_9HYPH|nr:dihydrodipicolinate synthase family protein [Phreatobacter stygius]QCI67086.1 dihydrodipicolinate synthase family protein [Phreatobacter stygius]